MKAWIVRDANYEYSTVVFANTRNEAKKVAMYTDVCEDMEYIQIKPHRFKEADYMYRGLPEMDWYDAVDRTFLVNRGWSCIEPEPDECHDCPAQRNCEKGMALKEYEKEEAT